MQDSGCGCNELADLTKYYTCQTDICLRSELFGDRIFEHGSKVVMLFAEIYSFMVEKYGLNVIASVMIQFENSNFFKQWFWNIKHFLGQQLICDPSFCDIGKWIGRGLFLKICLTMIYYNNLYLDETIINHLIEKQKKILDELIKDNYFEEDKKAIDIIDNGYILLREKTILAYDSEYFFKENVIYNTD
ncbi:MAG: hypothetical protein A2Y34_16395 [Spirochaetes bacterium GWC1_27_15]|nr:MAG: hypothetical protein A2Z98_09355 [Spirochaetes bacterium GWB1_27_13]OHD24371.1 MAG: hypothetical protein A2Y34_16395 [Spirochaetes bacterium GWC1_27_15]